MLLHQYNIIKYMMLTKKIVYFRIYTSSKVKQACEGVDVAIACLGTGNNCSNYCLLLTHNVYAVISYYVVGSELEREGHDRSDISLPGNQLQLLKDVSTVANCMLTHQGYLHVL